MKNLPTIALAFLALSGSAAIANDQVAADTLFHSLGIDKKSVKLESYRDVADSYYKLTLSFKILPNNSCQENYAGLMVNKKGQNSYTVVYASPINARCKRFARPRTVAHTLNFGITTESLPPRQSLKLNGKTYWVTDDNGTLTLSK